MKLTYSDSNLICLIVSWDYITFASFTWQTPKQTSLCQLSLPKIPWWVPVVFKVKNLLMCLFGPFKAWCLPASLASDCSCSSYSAFPLFLCITRVPPTTGPLYKLLPPPNTFHAPLHLVNSYSSFRYPPPCHFPRRNSLHAPTLTCAQTTMSPSSFIALKTVYLVFCVQLFY